MGITDSQSVQRIEVPMKKLSLLLACALLCGTASLAAAACSPEEAQKKAQADPKGYAEIMQELQPQLTELQQKQDLERLCQFYDAALEKLN